MAKTSTANPVYVYVGQGFIAGLPKTVTMPEAERLGLLEELQAAIENGSYVETPLSTVETPLSATPTSPQMVEHNFGGRKRKENN